MWNLHTTRCLHCGTVSIMTNKDFLLASDERRLGILNAIDNIIRCCSSPNHVYCNYKQLTVGNVVTLKVVGSE